VVHQRLELPSKTDQHNVEETKFSKENRAIPKYNHSPTHRLRMSKSQRIVVRGTHIRRPHTTDGLITVGSIYLSDYTAQTGLI